MARVWRIFLRSNGGGPTGLPADRVRLVADPAPPYIVERSAGFTETYNSSPVTTWCGYMCE